MGLPRDLIGIVAGTAVVIASSIALYQYSATPEERAKKTEQRIKQGKPALYLPKQGDMVSFCAIRQGVPEEHVKSYVKVVSELPENLRPFHGQPRIRGDWLIAGRPVYLPKLRKEELDCRPQKTKTDSIKPYQ